MCRRIGTRPHGAGNCQHLEASASGASTVSGLLMRSRLAGPHHGDARALLRDLSMCRFLKRGRPRQRAWVTARTRSCRQARCAPAPRPLPTGFLRNLFADCLEVLPRHNRAFRGNGAAQSRGRPLRLVGVDADCQLGDKVRARAAEQEGVDAASDFGDIWRSRLTFTS